MNRFWCAPLGLLLTFLASVQPLSAVAADGLRVMVSIKPVHSILSALMQGADNPELIVTGQLPFDYRLSSDQRERLSQADLLVWTGPELEPFLVQPVAKLDNRTRVLELLDHPALKILPGRWNEERRDPFFWLDTRNVLILVDELTRTLIDLDPVRAHLYLRNRQKLQAEISELDRRFEYGYRDLQQGAVLVYHDSLQYFAQAYALRLGDVLSPLPERPMDAARLLAARSQLLGGEVQCILTERGMPAAQLSLLTEGISDLSVAALDSLGDALGAGPGLYRQLMEYNASVIRGCLGQSQRLPTEIDAAERPQAVSGELGGSFLLTDHLGRLVSEKDFLGQYNLIYFGYTFCPDVCPTSLQVMSLALRLLGERAEQIQPWFVTIDPDRDKVLEINRYVGYFDKNLKGLTGSPEMIERIAARYRVSFQKVQEGDDPELYVMDHTASLFLVGPDGRFITKFAHGITPQALADRLGDIL